MRRGRWRKIIIGEETAITARGEDIAEGEETAKGDDTAKGEETAVISEEDEENAKGRNLYSEASGEVETESDMTLPGACVRHYIGEPAAVPECEIEAYHVEMKSIPTSL